MRSATLKQAQALQNLAFDTCLALLPEQRADYLPNLIRGFDTCAERARLIRGKPLPGSLRPERVSRRKGQRNAGLIVDAPVSPEASAGVPDALESAKNTSNSLSANTGESK
jgi:hypothetical protein